MPLVRTNDLLDGVEVKPRTQTGVVAASQIDALLNATIRVLSVVLVLLSIYGTFYGMLGRPAPLTNAARLVSDLVNLWPMFLVAFGVQALMSLLQWGAAVKAKRDPRWWIGYLLSLGVSVWLSWSGYADPLIALGMPPVLLFFLILGGDILPERMLIISK